MSRVLRSTTSRLVLMLGLLLALTPLRAAAGAFEISLGFSYSRSNYQGEDFSWNRRWGSSFGYHFTERSGIELSFQDVVDRTKIANYEDTTFHDQIYSASWIQTLTGPNYPVQPYVKAGVGQLNREATGSYVNGGVPPSRVDSITGVFGAGMRVYLTRTFALRSEITSYLTGGSIRTWKDNVAITMGLSLYL